MMSMAVFPLPTIQIGLSASSEYFMIGCHLGERISTGLSECTEADTGVEKSIGCLRGMFTPVAMIILSATMATDGSATPPSDTRDLTTRRTLPSSTEWPSYS